MVFLTNNGTVIWAANAMYGYGASVINNAGLWDSVSDVGITTQFGTNTFISTGTLEKTGGTGTSTIGWNLTSTGPLNTLTGSLSLNFSGNSILGGRANLSASLLHGTATVASNAVINWQGGTINGALNISTNAVVNWGNSADHNSGSMTVAGRGC